MFKNIFSKKDDNETLEEEARKLEGHGQYAEAAEKLVRVAGTYVDENPLIYARYCQRAVQLWIKAKESGKALQQAQEMFQLLDNTGWLKRSMEKVLDMKSIIDEFKAANYTDEAKTFADLLNNKLKEFGLMLKPSGAHHPSQCPSCGAQLPHAEMSEEITCSFCGYVIQVN